MSTCLFPGCVCDIALVGPSLLTQHLPRFNGHKPCQWLVVTIYYKYKLLGTAFLSRSFLLILFSAASFT